MAQEPTGSRPWWADAVIYQIYVRSFQDSDGDGIGDLDGVIRRLDHLTLLGVDALWLSPFHPSPLFDGGYDIADFEGVDPLFGTLSTFDRLVAAAHARGLRVVMDFVPNHTSDQHPWFRESRASADNPKRDWYVWREGEGDGPPNNWGAMLLDGPAWTRDDGTGQYYYHAFLPEQPDLNWRNEGVVAAMSDALRFWLARGVDGVRVDAVPHLVEDDLLRDDVPGDLDGEGMPVQGGHRHVFTSNRPETLARVAGLRRVLDERPDRVMIGEVQLPTALVNRYYGSAEAPGLHLPFNFILLHTAWDARALAAAIDQYLYLLPAGAHPNWVLGNHDETRIASRLGREAARSAALLLLTLGGTVVLYSGDELGLEEVPFGPADLGRVPEMRHPAHALKYAPHRTPMPWDDTRHGGFTTGEPWLATGEANARRHVAGQAADERSVLALYRRLIALRRDEPALAVGAYSPLPAKDGVLAFRRKAGGRRVLVALNTGATPANAAIEPGTVLLSTGLDRDGERCGRTIALLPHEGVVLTLD